MPLSNFDMKDICDAYLTARIMTDMEKDMLGEQDEEEYGWFNPYATYEPNDD